MMHGICGVIANGIGRVVSKRGSRFRACLVTGFVANLVANLVGSVLAVTLAHGEPPEGAVEIPADELLIIETTKGNILVALSPEFAPVHVARIQKLARERFYDGLIFHRVIDDFMVQGGSPELSNVRRPEHPNLMAEFTNRVAVGFRPNTIGEVRAGQLTIGEHRFTRVNGDRPLKLQFPFSGGDLSVHNGYVVFHEPAGRAAFSADGKVMANIQHCTGVASMARTADENSASTQFFLMRAPASWLDRAYTAWGRVVAGQEIVQAIALSETDEHGEDLDYPDRMYSVRLAADLDEAKRPRAYWTVVDHGELAAAVLAAAESTQGSEFDVCAFMPEAYVENFSAKRRTLSDILGAG